MDEESENEADREESTPSVEPAESAKPNNGSGSNAGGPPGEGSRDVRHPEEAGDRDGFADERRPGTNGSDRAVENGIAPPESRTEPRQPRNVDSQTEPASTDRHEPQPRQGRREEPQQRDGGTDRPDQARPRREQTAEHRSRSDHPPEGQAPPTGNPQGGQPRPGAHQQRQAGGQRARAATQDDGQIAGHRAPGQPQQQQPLGGQQLPGQERKDPGIAAILSFFITGLGQIYNEELGKGVLLILIQLVNVVLALFVIGIFTFTIVWMVGIWDAYASAKKINRGEKIV